VKQHGESYTVTVKFTFDPWDLPSMYPVGYAADALAAVDAVIEAGFEALDKADEAHEAAALAVWQEGERDELTTQEVADQLNVSRPYVIKLAKSGELPHRKVGNRYRFTASDVDGYEAFSRSKRAAHLAALASSDKEAGQ
jgi:excisionase family DNA binding protein